MSQLSFEIKWDRDDEKVEFEVVSLEGREAISELYEFKIRVIPLDKLGCSLLYKRAVLTINISFDEEDGSRGSQKYSYNGIISDYKQCVKPQKNPYSSECEIVFMPELVKLKYTKKSNIFVDTGLKDILTTVVSSNSIENGLYEVKLSQDAIYTPSIGYYNRYSYICQYEESDWNFLNRLLERDGVYYYFEQKDDKEICVITDSGANERGKYPLIGFEEVGEEDPNLVSDVQIQSQFLPQQVTIMNFGYEKAALGENKDGVISCSAYVSADGKIDSSLFGEHIIYGENFVNPDKNEDGDVLAKIRAQEIFWQGNKVLTVESTLVPVSAGMKIEIEDDNIGGEYLVVEVQHKGDKDTYSNTLKLIPANVQYRPLRKTPWPRIYGTMNALIDGAATQDASATKDGAATQEGNTTLPDLDDMGRYLIKLPFLKTAKPDGQGSIRVRLATPFAGHTYGMHFPLYKGTEVVLSFRDGNPDLPVIMAAVFNSEHWNVVINKNNYMGGVIVTRANSELSFDDSPNKAHAINIETNNNVKRFQ